MAKKATVNDLTVEQIEKIERAVGVPLNRWVEDAPKGALYPLILAAFNGTDAKTYSSMKFMELVALVALDDGEDADPNEPSEPTA